jgi:hypothetical protein
MRSGFSPGRASKIPEPTDRFFGSLERPRSNGPANFSRGAARVSVVGPFALTMTADDGVQAAHAFSEAKIVPIHYEGWKHFSESRDVISRAFEAGLVAGFVG